MSARDELVSIGFKDLWSIDWRDDAYDTTKAVIDALLAAPGVVVAALNEHDPAAFRKHVLRQLRADARVVGGGDGDE